MRLVRVGLGNVNSTVGAIPGNLARIKEQLAQMVAEGITVACFPEQALGGYAPEDLVQWRGFVEAQWAALEELARESTHHKTVVVVGVTVQHLAHLYNCAAVLFRGKILALIPKEKLPTYGVFYEQRTFSPGTPGQLTEHHGVPLGDVILSFDFGALAVEVCEDIWSPDGPMRRRCYAGAELVVNLSASPFRMGVVSTRREMLSTRSSDNLCALVYVNLIGANDALLFDGGGWGFSAGRPVHEAPRFREGWSACTLDLDRVARLRAESTTWRMDALEHGKRHPPVRALPQSEPAASRERLSYPVPAHGSFFLPVETHRLSACDELCEDVLDALALGVGDYMEKTGAFRGIGIALSGGRDSLLTTLVAHRYLQRKLAHLDEPARRAKMAELLHLFYMPSRFSSGITHDVAKLAAEELGARLTVLPIEEAFGREEEITRTMLGGAEVTEITRQNIQARLRSLRMWNWSNTSGFLFLQSGNMSEKAMGYTTIGGDLEGALGVLANVPKTLVIYLLEYLRKLEGLACIERCFSAPAGPELAADQRGEDELMPFRVLDSCFYLYAGEKMSPSEIVSVLGAMFPEDPPGAHREWVRHFVRSFTRNIYKWVQAPLSLHIGNLDLDRERALQLPVVESDAWASLEDLPKE